MSNDIISLLIIGAMVLVAVVIKKVPFRNRKLLNGYCEKCNEKSIVLAPLPDNATGEWDSAVSWFCEKCHASGTIFHKTDDSRYNKLYLAKDETDSEFRMIPTRKKDSSNVYVSWYNKEDEPIIENSLTGYGDLIHT